MRTRTEEIAATHVAAVAAWPWWSLLTIASDHTGVGRPRDLSEVVLPSLPSIAPGRPRCPSAQPPGPVGQNTEPARSASRTLTRWESSA